MQKCHQNINDTQQSTASGERANEREWERERKKNYQANFSNVNLLKHLTADQIFNLIHIMYYFTRFCLFSLFCLLILHFTSTSIWRLLLGYFYVLLINACLLHTYYRWVRDLTIDYNHNWSLSLVQLSTSFLQKLHAMCVCEWALAQVFEYSMCNKWLYFMHVWTDVGATRIEIDREMFSATFEKDSDVGISFFWGR